MSFGGLFVGNSGQVIIDENYPVHHWVYSGTYSLSSVGTVTVTFPAPINSPVPPALFLAPDGAHIVRNLRLTGTAGNWTGFTCYLYADSGFSGVVYSGKWKVAGIYLPAAGSWGLRVFDASSRIVFDSNRDMVAFLSGTQVWSKIGYNGGYLSQWTTDTYAATYTIGAYFLANPWCAKFPAASDAEAGIGFLSGGSSTATQVCSFLMRAGNGQVAAGTFNWPLILAK
ncbi:hypothetical protein [Pseudomonas citronellolis]|jgi:hypothetical protein|uniref:hypothetical protein n=1 Tax=Pseudomonas citronellolis TaxID=53408 RepID=UPI00389AC520